MWIEKKGSSTIIKGNKLYKTLVNLKPGVVDISFEVYRQSLTKLNETGVQWKQAVRLDFSLNTQHRVWQMKLISDGGRKL